MKRSEQLNQTIVDNDDGTITVSGKCVFTEKRYSVTADKEAYGRWSRGEEKIQHALPTLNTGDREFLMTGVSPVGWDETFKK